MKYPNLYVCGPKSDDRAPRNELVLNVTSQSLVGWMMRFSPFLLGPVEIPNWEQARNLENAWQYSKVYPQHVDRDTNEILPEWYDWAIAGYNKQHADRYPMGKGAKPLFHYWNKQRLDYVSARKQIYVPLYVELVQSIPEFFKLKELVEEMARTNLNVYLWDFDGRNHRSGRNNDNPLPFSSMIEDVSRPLGHANVLWMALQGEI